MRRTSVELEGAPDSLLEVTDSHRVVRENRRRSAIPAHTEHRTKRMSIQSEERYTRVAQRHRYS